MAYSWLGPLRKPARAVVVRLLRQALASDDGRRILCDELRGLTVLGGLSGGLPPHPPDYAELGNTIDAGHGVPPVFVTGRFRSGSTLVWNLFRHVPGCRAYYEPLNERRWFDPSVRGTRVDASHVGVADYWREYDGLTALGELYDIEWTRRRLYMRPGDTDAKLFAYIAALVHQSPERAVLQFNRVDFRLPWLVRHFPTARFVHIFREPRDQWCSTLQGDAFPRTGTVAEFESRDQFYLLSWARDLAAFFPFMDPRDAAHPYEVFYYIWRLSHAFGQRYCHVSFGYEALCQSPEVEIPRLMDAAGIPSGEYDMSLLQSLVHPRGVGRWQSYADDSWFRRHEIRCEVELEKFFASDAAHDERSEETAALLQRRTRRELAVRSA